MRKGVGAGGLFLCLLVGRSAERPWLNSSTSKPSLPVYRPLARLANSTSTIVPDRPCYVAGMAYACMALHLFDGMLMVPYHAVSGTYVRQDPHTCIDLSQ